MNMADEIEVNEVAMSHKGKKFQVIVQNISWKQ